MDKVQRIDLWVKKTLPPAEPEPVFEDCPECGHDSVQEWRFTGRYIEGRFVEGRYVEKRCRMVKCGWKSSDEPKQREEITMKEAFDAIPENHA